MNEVYYKLYESRNKLITIVCMQWFDEHDYHQNNFVKDSNGDAHSFESEEAAIVKLNEWFKPEEIDPEYRNSTLTNVYK